MLLTDENCTDMKLEDCNINNTYVLLEFYRHPTDKNVIGEFRHLYMDKGIIFTDISNFIYQLELLLEQLNKPQATTTCRKTWKKENCEPLDTEPIHMHEDPVWVISKRNCLSYIIHIRYRCNSSWQGEVRWLDKKHGQTIYFRSVLELLMLLEAGTATIRNQPVYR